LKKTVAIKHQYGMFITAAAPDNKQQTNNDMVYIFSAFMLYGTAGMPVC
jgi:hypothetical protein